MTFFNSIKEIKKLRKEINRLLIKGIQTFTFVKKLLSRKTDDFLSSKNLSPGKFLGAPTHADIIKF